MRKKACTIVIFAVCFMLCITSIFAFSSCNPTNPTATVVDLSEYAPEIRQAIVDFVAAYGKDSAGYTGNAYIVSDFDNTTAIYDITYQCSVHQINTMSFNLTPAEMRDALGTGLNLSELSFGDYIDDVVNAYEHLYNSYGPFGASGISQDMYGSVHNDIWWAEFSAKLKGLYTQVENNLDDAFACTWIMFWYTNMTEQEVYSLFKDSCQTYANADTQSITWRSPEQIDSKVGQVECSFILGCSVSQSVKNMLKYYISNGIDTWICSASHIDGVRAAVDAYGLSDRITGVIGMTQKMQNGKFVAEYDFESGLAYTMNSGNWQKSNAHPIAALPSREGKVQAIRNVLVPMYNAGPLAGFMDASGDFNFCTEFDSVKMVICYNRADRKITEGGGLVAIAAMYQKSKNLTLQSANSAGDTLYLLQGRDENGKRCLRPSNLTVKLGKNEEKLFANEDNVSLFNYLAENELSLSEYFNKFAIKTPASNQNNPIGVHYGFLTEYAGYKHIK